LDRDTLKIEFGNNDELLRLLGVADEGLFIIEEVLQIKGLRRVGNAVFVPPSPMSMGLVDLLNDLRMLVEQGQTIHSQDLHYAVRMLLRGRGSDFINALSREVNVSNKGNPIRPRTLGQARYVRAMENSKIVFCMGPAGTGKTFLAAALAARYLKNREISRIILTRPTVEAGEKLGFLPGELKDKVDPYFKPLYDAMLAFFPQDKFAKFIERGVVEIAPLAYMRGRTLSDSFLILDEAQNTTQTQMKMFLTRIGEGSTAIITGDQTQVDLPLGVCNGLQNSQSILDGIDGIEFVCLDAEDVVRHSIVQRIICAYSEHDQRSRESEKTSSAEKSVGRKGHRRSS
jgi:phosphate starvation-inducible PhoH-like protein